MSMYSRYQPFEPMDNLLHGRAAEPVPTAVPKPCPPAPAPRAPGSAGKGGGPLSGLLKNVKLNLDSGDVLLLLIILFLSQECDDMELLILLGLVLFMGL